jgi:large subunit ribosomal protein L15
MPLQRRIPKRGFSNLFKKRYRIINVSDLEQFDSGSEIGPRELLQSGLVKAGNEGIKLLADGEISRPFTVRVNKASAAAISKVETAGGRVELIPEHKRD